MNPTLSSAANSGPSVGASSLVTDANSALSGGPHLQRSASMNAESYTRLPASPMSFSSNNVSISGSSVLDGSSVVQSSSHQDQTSQPVMQRQQHGASSATSMPTRAMEQVSPTGPLATTSINYALNNFVPVHKKPRLDMRQEEMLQQQVIQQLLQRQDTMHLQGHNLHVQALLQQQKLMQQRQHMLPSMPQMKLAPQQPQQLRQHLHPGIHPASAIKRTYDSGICARRLMQYLYHQRYRPGDNNIVYWRKFVAEYFAPHARMRLCLSLYDNVGHSGLGVFPQSVKDSWQCDLCGAKSGRGFETPYEILPLLNKIKFDSGVMDELLFVDMPHEFRSPSGIMMLEYGKAVQESVYEQLRVVHEGQLRIIFSPDLKIISWEFCLRRHEELLPRRLVSPQVNQLVQVAQKYQTLVNGGGSGGVSTKDLQTNCSMFVTAGHQLARNLDLQSLNDLGFSKRYVRFLQMSDVVNSMKDLMDFSREHKLGPIVSLKNCPQSAVQAKLPKQEMQGIEQLLNVQGLPADQNDVNKMMMTTHPGPGSHINNPLMHGGNSISSGAQHAVALNNYRNLLRQNSMNLTSNNALHPDPSPSLNCPNSPQTLPFQGPVSLTPGANLLNLSMNGQLSCLPSQNLIQQSRPSSQANQHLHQLMIQQLLQEMMNTGGQQPSFVGGQSLLGNSTGGAFGGTIRDGSSLPRAGASVAGFNSNLVHMSSNPVAVIPSRNNSFRSHNSSPTVSGNSFSAREDTQNLHLSEPISDIPREFSDSLFDDESFGWES